MAFVNFEKKLIKTGHSLFLKPRGLLFVNDCFKNQMKVIFHDFSQSSTNGINQIEKISAPNHEQLFEYDGLNRMFKTTETINGSSFEFAFTFNNLNQITTMEYPNGLVVANLYDNNGYLDEVKKLNGDLIWKAEEQDAYGRYVEYSKGDGVTTELFFDAFQNLAEIEAGNVQHHLYNWDIETGNLNYRRDLIKQLEEDFLYDNLNRLTKATASPMGSILVLNQIETNYETNGNIKDKSDAGEYAYHPTKPNAVTGVSNDNLNISLLNQDITYNAFNKAETITEEDGYYSLNFIYGHDKQRRKTTFYENNILVLEKYFVGLYEKEFEPQTGITRHINYITAGDGMTAIVLQEEENGDISEETYFTYKDHLGSIVALTDETGDVVLEQSFDAWGRYRDPNDWTYNILNPSPTWLRGYTGHEHLPHFDLINMNGRIYDPILGRMLSPDRFIQDPLFSQSYNRYSYCWNNPLRYTDPSGDAVVAGMVIGAVVGGYIGGAIQSQNFNPFTAQYWNDGWQGFLGGAIVGGLTGWSVGAKIAANKAAAAQGVASANATSFGTKFYSGAVNALYSYDSEQGLGVHTLAHFGAGFLGAHVYTQLGLLNGLLVGGSANVAAHMLGGYDYDENADPIGYQIAQKFVGGALSVYTGAAFDNQAISYMGMGEDYHQIGKGLSYATQAYAQNFAYSSRTAYTEMGYMQHIMTGVIGFGMGVGYYNIGEIDFSKYKQNRPILRQIATYTTRYGVGFALGITDYRLHISNQQYYDINDYSGHAQKLRIYSVKTLFNFLLLNQL